MDHLEREPVASSLSPVGPVWRYNIYLCQWASVLPNTLATLICHPLELCPSGQITLISLAPRLQSPRNLISSLLLMTVINDSRSIFGKNDHYKQIFWAETKIIDCKCLCYRCLLGCSVCIVHLPRRSKQVSRVFLMHSNSIWILFPFNRILDISGSHTFETKCIR